MSQILSSTSSTGFDPNVKNGSAIQKKNKKNTIAIQLQNVMNEKQKSVAIACWY